MRYFTTKLLLSFSFLMIGCGQTTYVTPPSEKKSVGGTLLFQLNSAQVKKAMLAAGAEDSDIKDKNIFGLRVYKISYFTKDSHKHTIRASGILSIPLGIIGTFPLLNYNHGTITLENRIPSVKSTATKQPSLASLIFGATGGFATLETDYIGYGDSSKHYHPYMLKEALANASINLIKEARKFAKHNNIKLNKQLYVTGYSEGGYVSMATVEKLEKLHIKVSAASPMAGAYDLNYMARAVMGLENESLKTYATTYTILTLNAYAKKYNKDISTIVKKPYDTQIDKLLDGKHSFTQIDTILETEKIGKIGLLKETFLTTYKNNPNYWFRRALKKNSVYNWRPKTPLKLIHCQGDDQVPYTISARTVKVMRKNGSKNISLLTPDLMEKSNKKWGHIQCILPSMLSAENWFLEVRKNIELMSK